MRVTRLRFVHAVGAAWDWSRFRATNDFWISDATFGSRWTYGAKPEAQAATFDTAHAMLAGENLPMILGTLPIMLTMAFDFIERGRVALFDPKYQRKDVTRIGTERVDAGVLRDRMMALFAGGTDR